jgi:hypothetical protein
MLAHFPNQEQNPAVAQIVIEDFLSAVDDLPAYAVDAGVRSLLLTGMKWKPNVAQLRDACVLKGRHYAELKGYVKTLIAHWGE